MMGCKKDRRTGQGSYPVPLTSFRYWFEWLGTLGQNRDYEKRGFYRATPTYIGDGK